VRLRSAQVAGAAAGTAEQREWRCNECGTLLGVLKQGRLHIRVSHGRARQAEYLVGLPAFCTCEHCHSPNEIRDIAAALERTVARNIAFRKA
jgi:hypothetical protein